jgi:hypothetical protein
LWGRWNYRAIRRARGRRRLRRIHKFAVRYLSAK